MGMPKFKGCQEKGTVELTWAAVCLQGHLQHVSGELESTQEQAREDRNTLRAAVHRVREEKAQLAAELRAANQRAAEYKEEIERLREVLCFLRRVLVVESLMFDCRMLPCAFSFLMYLLSQVLIYPFLVVLNHCLSALIV
jgi:hypothetical protein